MKQGSEWIICYTNFDIFTWRDGTPWDAPREHVQIIASSHPERGFLLEHGKEFFYYEEDKGGWYSAFRETMLLHLLRAKQPLVAFGEMMNDADWVKLFTQFKREVVEKQYGWRYVKPQ